MCRYKQHRPRCRCRHNYGRQEIDKLCLFRYRRRHYFTLSLGEPYDERRLVFLGQLFGIPERPCKLEPALKETRLPYSVIPRIGQAHILGTMSLIAQYPNATLPQNLAPVDAPQAKGILSRSALRGRRDFHPCPRLCKTARHDPRTLQRHPQAPPNMSISHAESTLPNDFTRARNVRVIYRLQDGSVLGRAAEGASSPCAPTRSR